MHRLMTTAIAALSVCALTSCASQPPPSPTANLGQTNGTVTFSGGAVAIGIGFQWGNGTLTYQGRQYPFRVNGLSVLDVGVSSVTGSGTVRNLNKVADFSGNYVSATAGATVAGGGSVTPCSLAGINPAHHPEIFGNPATAASYGFVRGRDGVWHVAPNCHR